MQRGLPHAKDQCGAPTRECGACYSCWKACQQCSRLYLKKAEDPLTSCPDCREPRATRYRFNQGETVCPMCDEPRACSNPNVKGRDKCRMHGGKSKRGAEHPNFKHGYDTEGAPLALMRRYKEYVKDPERQSLAHEIALARALVVDSLLRLERGEDGKLWRDLQTTFEHLVRATKSDKPGAVTQALTQHYLVIKRGNQNEVARKELNDAIELTGKLKEKETKRERDLNLMIGVEEFYVLMARTLSVIERYVPKAEQDKLYNEFESIMVADPTGKIRPS